MKEKLKEFFWPGWRKIVLTVLFIIVPLYFVIQTGTIVGIRNESILGSAVNFFAAVILFWPSIIIWQYIPKLNFLIIFSIPWIYLLSCLTIFVSTKFKIKLNKKILIWLGILIVVIALMASFYPKIQPQEDVIVEKNISENITANKTEKNLSSGKIENITPVEEIPLKEGFVLFETIEKNEYQKVPNWPTYKVAGNYVIQNESEWTRIYGLEWACSQCPAFSVYPPQVDFSNTTVIAVFMGEKSSGGYSIEIARIFYDGKKVIVYINETYPKPGQDVTLAMTQPYHIVKTQKITKPVDFFPKPVEKCSDYTRNGNTIQKCATCGNGVCEDFEKCTPSGCSDNVCTTDCGPLYCEEDCK